MIQSTIEQLLRPTIETMGYEFWGCQYIPQGGSSLLRLYIDKVTGIGIHDCEQVSRQVSAVLDVADPISGEYSLEVSSPGIPRPLFYSTQYLRYIGEQVVIKLTRPVVNQRMFTGVIVSVEDDVLVLDLGTEEQKFPFNTIAKAHLTSK